MTNTETMKLALEALEAHADIGIKSDKAITALRTAIEAAEKQEPVAWAEEIITDLHALYDSEMITENDSGDALIRLDAAVYAVEEAEQRHTTTPAAPVQFKVTVVDDQHPNGVPLSQWLTGCPECGLDGGCDCDSGTWNPPEAQRLAAQLEAGDIHECAWQAAAELRRLEWDNAQLLEALRDMVNTLTDGPDESDIARVFSVARAAIAAAKGEA